MTSIRQGCYTILAGYTSNQVYAAALCYGLVQSGEFNLNLARYFTYPVIIWDVNDHTPRQTNTDCIPNDYVEIKVDDIINNMAKYLNELDNR